MVQQNYFQICIQKNFLDLSAKLFFSRVKINLKTHKQMYDVQSQKIPQVHKNNDCH